ncbi:MAG: sigma-54 dependent transcriptional regulator [Thermoanaerobaculales bacterium]|nr:sigma-54 dependent transcriptional regulator [Thermoanaerobaculales bacterium]
MTFRALVVEDDQAASRVIALNLVREGFEVRSVENAAEALRFLPEAHPDVVLTDYLMPDMNGLELLSKIRREWPQLPVIMMTGQGDERLAVQAMKEGAFTYLSKPLDYDELALMCRRAAEMHSLRCQLERADVLELGHGLVGEAPAIRQLRRLIADVAPTPVTVLIRGETGTGKEVVARAIHAASGRASETFVAINCSAIPESLLEAELFGHERGAFTGANRRRVGRFLTAAGGTLFLDEVGDLPASLQPKLLRVLEERAVTPLGSDKPIPVDVRLVTATHQPLEQLVENGRFRQDLFYRLNVVPLHIPPLRERREDIARLASRFAGRIATRHGKSIRDLAPELVEWLKIQEWEGNVRELENIIERLVIFSTDGVLRLPDDGIESAILPPYRQEKERILDSFEMEYLKTALRLARGRLADASERTGLSARQLYNLMKKHGLDKEEFFLS